MLYLIITFQPESIFKPTHTIKFKIANLVEGELLVEFYKKNITGAKMIRAVVIEEFDTIP